MAVTYPRPGTAVLSRTDPSPRGLASDSGTWFAVGIAQKGPTNKAQRITSLQQFVTYFGNRISTSVLYDSVETFFREGGQVAYIIRTAGPSAVSASKTLLDASAGNSLLVTAKNPGVWGNGLSVAVTQPAAGVSFQILITQSGIELDRSPVMTTQAEAINWSAKSDYVTVTYPGTPSALIPAVASAAALTSGADDTAGVTDTIRQTALTYFTADLGGGQVSIPGNTASANRTALIAHAAAYSRHALLDVTDTPSRSTALTEASGLQAGGNEFGSLFGPWCYIPGATTGLPNRIVPPSAFVAGLLARSDGTRSVNEPAMGIHGQARYVVDVTQPAWSDTDRDLLNSAGLNVIRSAPQQGVQLYGFRTLANPQGDTSYLGLNNQRLRELISIQARDVAASFVGEQLDGKGRTLAAFGGRLGAILMEHYNAGALYGDTPDEAFNIDVGPTVNTTATLANNELHAVISLRMSPFAELVIIEIVKVGVAAAL